MIFSLVEMTRLEKCCITSAYLQWLCHSGERSVARGPRIYFSIFLQKEQDDGPVILRKYRYFVAGRCFTFAFCILLVKKKEKQSRVFETGSVGLAETQLIFLYA